MSRYYQTVSVNRVDFWGFALGQKPTIRCLVLNDFSVYVCCKLQKLFIRMIQQKTRIAAYGIVVREQRVLLCRISSELPRWQGQWTLPGGGIEFGEAPEDAMVREVQEETGLVVSAGPIFGIDSLHDNQSDPEFHGVRIVYGTTIVRGKLENERSGTTDLAQWFLQQELAAKTLVDIAQFGVGFAFK